MDPNNLFYATYAKGFRPGGGNAPLPGYCDGDGGLNQAGYPNGAPLTYNSDTTQSFEVGSKNSVSERFRIATSVYYIKWKNIQQNVYVPYNCGLQFTDNLGTAVAKGFDLQAEMAFAQLSADVVSGYTSACHRIDAAAAPAGRVGDRSAKPANIAPEPTPYGRNRRPVQLQLAAHDALCALAVRGALTGSPGPGSGDGAVSRRPTPCHDIVRTARRAQLPGRSPLFRHNLSTRARPSTINCRRPCQ
jgi:outer membrane receptor protein involved in Fe transport